MPLHLVRFRQQFLSTLIHKLLSILDCDPIARRIMCHWLKLRRITVCRDRVVEVTIGVLCYDVYLNDLRYLVLLI